jgi:hypothetical protein
VQGSVVSEPGAMVQNGGAAGTSPDEVGPAGIRTVAEPGFALVLAIVTGSARCVLDLGLMKVTTFGGHWLGWRRSGQYELRWGLG